MTEQKDCPPAAELPWMRAEITGESGRLMVFAMAVHDGRIVETAPIARRMLNMSARDAWKMLARRGAKLSRIG